MLSARDVEFENITEKLVQLPRRDSLEMLSDKQLSNLILVVRESQTELGAFIQAIQAVQMERERSLLVVVNEWGADNAL
jgi:hypothetical protein